MGNHGIHAFKEIRVGRKEDFFVQGFRESGEQFARAICFHRTVKALPLRLIEVAGVGAILLVVAVTVLRGGEPVAILPTMGLLTAAGIRLMASVNRILGSITAIRHFYPALQAVGEEFRTIDELPPVLPNRSCPSQPHGMSPVSKTSPTAIRGRPQMPCPTSASRSTQGSRSLWLAGQVPARRRSPICCSVCSPRPPGASSSRALFGRSLSSRLAIGYVPQPSYLLDESIRKNVAFGTDEADIDDARVVRSLDSVQMKQVVEEMDGQLAFRVGRDGMRVWGGSGKTASRGRSTMIQRSWFSTRQPLRSTTRRNATCLRRSWPWRVNELCWSSPIASAR